MTKTYEERFLEEYTGCDREKELYEKRIKKYKQMIDTLKQEDIKNIIDEALKEQTSLVLSFLKIDKVELEYNTKNLIKKFSSETIYDKLNRKIYNIENYVIHGLEEHKKLLLQIKDLGLVKNYYDVVDIASNMKIEDVKTLPRTIFKCLINGYKNTDYLMKLKDIMNEEFYTKCLNGKILCIEYYSREPFGLTFTFAGSDFYEIIPESVRINNLEGVIGININGHYLGSKEDMKNIGKHIEKGMNEIYLDLKNTPNKINRSIVYLAKVKY
jgi:uncharacterized protein YebE (UPF0316 family)